MNKYLINPTNNLDKIKLRKDEQLQLFMIITHGIDYSLEIILSGHNAQADIYGIIIGDKDAQINISTVQLHQAQKTRSSLLVKSVLTENSKFKFEGLIKVEKQAQKTDAFQKNANLLLSDNAQAESKPILEILADDVKCTHGVSIGNIDQEQLFYLTSRGISKKTAQKMLIQGFFQEIIDKIPDILDKAEFEQTIDKNLELV